MSQHPKTLVVDIVLRILLSHLPESLESSEYVPFLQDLTSGTIAEDLTPVDADALEELSDVAARKRVQKLHLLPLTWPEAPSDAPADPLVQFLIHRSLRIDKNTGLITQLPELLAPFIHRSAYLRTWMISTILPLLRLNYEYYPHDGINVSIPTFESWDDQTGIAMLLLRAGSPEVVGDVKANPVGRDLRGLVGPWMYGDTRLKQRNLQENSPFRAQTVVPLERSSCCR